jgi:hypothetical protein
MLTMLTATTCCWLTVIAAHVTPSRPTLMFPPTALAIVMPSLKGERGEI